MLIHKGRIWRAMEDEKGGNGWGHSFRAFIMSAPVDSDLLNNLDEVFILSQIVSEIGSSLVQRQQNSRDSDVESESICSDQESLN